MGNDDKAVAGTQLGAQRSTDGPQDETDLAVHENQTVTVVNKTSDDCECQHDVMPITVELTRRVDVRGRPRKAGPGTCQLSQGAVEERGGMKDMDHDRTRIYMGTSTIDTIGETYATT